MHLYQMSSLSLPITFSYRLQYIHTLGTLVSTLHSLLPSLRKELYRPYFDIIRLYNNNYYFKDNPGDILITIKSYLESLGSQSITSNNRNFVTVTVLI